MHDFDFKKSEFQAFREYGCLYSLDHSVNPIGWNEKLMLEFYGYVFQMTLKQVKRDYMEAWKTGKKPYSMNKPERDRAVRWLHKRMPEVMERCSREE